MFYIFMGKMGGSEEHLVDITGGLPEKQIKRLRAQSLVLTRFSAEWASC